MSNQQLAIAVLRALKAANADTCCICPGSRNSPLVQAIVADSFIKSFFWFEERSAAFFALGRSKRDETPVAVITTSGSAAAELLPAAMEAYYSAIPLLLITADRPRRFRGSGAPQSAEQVGIYGPYAVANWDIAYPDSCDLSSWSQQAPAHLNICFEEPNPKRANPCN
jgi:2-succinyl-5-enolpyruvyl-6-hydroxy-3-cyclohexene-1-carboxylate synthase